MILKPAPDDVQHLYLQSLEACGIDLLGGQLAAHFLPAQVFQDPILGGIQPIHRGHGQHQGEGGEAHRGIVTDEGRL